MGEAAGLIVLPDQLVGAVVDVGRGVGAVADGQDVAIIIIGVGIGNIVVSVTLGTVGGNEGGGMPGFGIVVGEVLPQDICAGIRLDVGGDHAGDPAEVIISIGHAAGALADGGHTVAPVVGIDRAAGVAVDILVQTGDEVLLVVGVLQRDLMIGAGLPVEHVPVHKIGGEACGDPGRGVRYGGPRAGIVVGIFLHNSRIQRALFTGV